MWRKGWRCPRGSAVAKYLILKKFSEIFHDIENVKDIMLGADPNLERTVTIHQGMAKMLAPCPKWYDKKTSTIQTNQVLLFFFREIHLFKSQCF